MESFEQQLSGGHPNSLGNTLEVVDTVLADNSRFDELFDCYFSSDEAVRLRVSNAMKRICKEQKQLLLPYIDRFLTEIANIDQASTKWTLAQLFLLLEKDMDISQIRKAKDLMANTLASHDDWIVLNMTMETLGRWAKTDVQLTFFMIPHLERLSADKRKSVSGKAKKWLAALA